MRDAALWLAQSKKPLIGDRRQLRREAVKKQEDDHEHYRTA
ncbi:hypothetical protein R2A130_2263 [Ahrensia sp. R2A130]|nr:hypothetical protein R2A130_2263 [Ahrensia sp. R2A130]